MGFAVVIYNHAHEVTTLATIDESLCEFRKLDRRIGGLCILHSQQRGPHEQAKCHEGRNGIARQTAKIFPLERAKDEWFAGAHGNFPEIERAAELFKRSFDIIK